MPADPEAEVAFWTDDMGAVPVVHCLRNFAWTCEVCGVTVEANQPHTCWKAQGGR